MRVLAIAALGLCVLIAAAPPHCEAGTLTVKDARLHAGPRPGASPAIPPESVSVGSVASAVRDSSATDRVVVAYFHRIFRCETCLKFEEYSEEAIREAFPHELAGGRLEWRVLNLDEHENAHYEDEHGISQSSLVVSIESEGEELKWRVIPDISDLVGDREAFIDYVTLEIGMSLQRLSVMSEEAERARNEDVGVEHGQSAEREHE